MKSQLLQRLPAELRLPIRVFLFGIGVFCAGLVGSLLFNAASANAVEMRLVYGYMIAGASGLLGAAAICLPLLTVAAIVLPALGAGTWVFARKVAAERLPIARSSTNQLGSGEPFPRLEIPRPDRVVISFPGETLEEACTRLERAIASLSGAKTACVLFAPRGRNVVEIHFGSGDYASLTREETGMLVSRYPEGYNFAGETYADYYQFAQELTRGYANGSESLKRERGQQQQTSPYREIANRAVLSYCLLLLPFFAFAGVTDQVRKSGIPADVLAQVPKQGVTFQFAKIGLSRPATGETVLDLLDNGAAFKDNADYGALYGIRVDGTYYPVTVGDPSKPKPLFDKVAASVPDSVSLSDRLKAADDATRKAKQELEDNADEISNSEFAGTVLFYVLILAVILAMLVGICFDESLVARSGEVIFGRSFLELGIKLKYALLLAAGIPAAAWLFFFAYSAKEHNDFTSPFKVFASKSAFIIYLCMFLAFCLKNFIVWYLADPRRDMGVNSTQERYFGGHQQRQLGSGK